MKKFILLNLFAILALNSFGKDKNYDSAGGASQKEIVITGEELPENLDEISSASIIPAALTREYRPKGFTKSDKKKALFVIGDLRNNSITYDMAYTAMKFLEENNIEVKSRDLYRMKWNPVLSQDEFYFQKDGIGKGKADVLKEQSLVKEADYIVFVYPNWHDSATAIVKGYQERVFSKNFAYTNTSTGPKGLLENKGIYTIMNCGFLGGGRGFINDGVGINDKKWNEYMKAYEVFDNDLANWWGMKNFGRFMNDRYPKNTSKNYKEQLEEIRTSLNENLKKTFINN